MVEARQWRRRDVIMALCLHFVSRQTPEPGLQEYGLWRRWGRTWKQSLPRINLVALQKVLESERDVASARLTGYALPNPSS